MRKSPIVRRILSLLQDGALSKDVARELLLECTRIEEPRHHPIEDHSIAIVGVAAKLPQASTLDEFWEGLAAGKDFVTRLPEARQKQIDPHYAGVPDDAFLPGGRYWDLAYLESIDAFDAGYFGIAGAEADVMDPAHRLFLETAVAAFENAGYGGAVRGTRTAVFTANPGFHYADAVLSEPSATAVTGNLPEFLGARVAHLLDLRGPVFGVQSTCSASLVAIQLACQALRAGDCEMALAGGATVFSFPGNVRSNPMTASGIVAPDQRCRPFSRGASGIGRGEGVIAFVLKPLARALADGDYVHAVIRGGALNNDGLSAGLTAPNPNAHAELLRAAWKDAGVDPTRIQYIEAHGTGTHLGDPIEIRGITDAFAGYATTKQFCAIGSVKGNIGHLVDGAAGASGLLKLVLMLRAGFMPPTIHFDEPNDAIDFVESPVYVVDRLTPWDRGEGRRLGGVSSFGFNGTNCHLIVEEAPDRGPAVVEDREELIVLSALDAEALTALAEQHRATWNESHALGDIAFTLAVGRDHLPTRLAFIARSVQEAREKLARVCEQGARRSDPATGIWCSADAGGEDHDGGDLHPGRAYVQKQPVDLRRAFEGRQPKRVPLATYPFKRDPHWVRTPLSRALSRMQSEDVPSQIAQIWDEVLGSSAEQNFFAAGGTSLLATMVVSRLRSRLGIDVPVRTLFESPTRSGFADAVARVLAKPTYSAAIPRVTREPHLPLSYAQERLWFLDQLHPGSATYNMPGVVRLRGRVDPSALERALAKVVDRHEALRTAFRTEDGEPRQIISPSSDMALACVDLRGLPEDERAVRADRLVLDDAARPFDLEKGPLLRAALVQLADEHHLLLLTMHHIVSDGWSLGILVRELATFYETADAVLPPLAIQYADYASFQRARLRAASPDASGAGVFSEQLAYWRNRLTGAPRLELPLDFPRPLVQTFAGAQERFILGAELSGDVRAFARAHGVTPFMLLLTVFVLLLGRYTGERDVVVGSPVANRHELETEGLIGVFVNALVLRTSIPDGASFHRLLEIVRDVVLEAQAHQDMPFERLVAELHTERDLARHPLFQVNFQLEKAILEPIALREMTLEPIAAHNRTAKFDLALGMTEYEDRIEAELEYASDLFLASTIERFGRHYLQLLHALLRAPDAPVDSVRYLDEAETQWLLEACNATRVTVPTLFVHEAFERQARETPHAVALRQGNYAMTYAELDRRANRLARTLLDGGVRAEERVGVFTQRGPQVLIAILAVLKAGAAYVPLEPRDPVARRNGIASDAGIRVVLVDERTSHDTAPAWVAIRVDTPESDEEHRAARPAVAGEQLAYVIYTSGSTGRPKGVMVTHAGLANYLAWCGDAYDVARGIGAPLHSSVAFDLTVTAMFPPLLCGKTVFFPEEDDGAVSLATLLREHPDFSVVKITPAHLAVLRELLSVEELGRLESVFVVGGDALHERDLAHYRAHAPRVRIVNEYGPTETVVGCCVHDACVPGEAGSAVPIGHPIANTRLYVLDDALLPVPSGVVGELFIGGAGVARGYLGQAELTASKFLHDPFASTPYARMFRTGDRVRRLPSGALEFLGRRDAQVKIRAHRIELVEVENALQCAPGIRHAAVVLAGDTPEGRHLIGYYVPDLEHREAATAERIHAHLRERLPEYMVPAALVALDALPLTTNGKVDHSALRGIRPQAPAARAPYVAPRSEAEFALAKIFADVLHAERIGIHDRFFECGGDSVLSIQVVARAARAGLRFSARDVFRAQTVAELANVAAHSDARSRNEDTARGDVPLTPTLRGFFEQVDVEVGHFNQAVMLEVRGAVDPVALRDALAHVHAHHDAFRLRYRTGDGRLYYESAVDPVSFDVIDLSAESVEEQQARIEERVRALHASLDLERGPLVRAALFERGERPSQLFIVIHHVAVDGVSWRILLEDWQEAYQAMRANRAVFFPPKTTSFLRYAERLLDRVHDEDIGRELGYWKEALSAPAVSLPFDRDGGPNLEGSTAVVHGSLGAPDTFALLQDVPATLGTHIQDTLLTALGWTMRKWAGPGAIRVDLDGHGRVSLGTDIDLSRTVGWFTLLVPFCIDIGHARDILEAVDRVRRQRRALPNDGIGHGLLRHAHPDPNVRGQLAALPKPDIAFNYLGQFDGSIDRKLFAPLPLQTGAWHGPRQLRPYLLNIDGHVLDGRLNVAWTYSRHYHDEATIRALSDGFFAALRSLVAAAKAMTFQSGNAVAR